VNGASWKATGTENVLDIVARAFCFHEDKDETFLDGQEELHQGLHLVLLFHVLDGLCNVLGGGSNATDS
jgi:hypothetical protein